MWPFGAPGAGELVAWRRCRPRFFLEDRYGSPRMDGACSLACIVRHNRRLRKDTQFVGRAGRDRFGANLGATAANLRNRRSQIPVVLVRENGLPASLTRHRSHDEARQWGVFVKGIGWRWFVSHAFLLPNRLRIGWHQGCVVDAQRQCVQGRRLGRGIAELNRLESLPIR